MRHGRQNDTVSGVKSIISKAANCCCGCCRDRDRGEHRAAAPSRVFRAASEGRGGGQTSAGRWGKPHASQGRAARGKRSIGQKTVCEARRKEFKETLVKVCSWRVSDARAFAAQFAGGISGSGAHP
jgi:hypothetical protein